MLEIEKEIKSLESKIIIKKTPALEHKLTILTIPIIMNSQQIRL